MADKLTVTINGEDWGTIVHILQEEAGEDLLETAVVFCDSCTTLSCAERAPNGCRCPCYGCKHHCAACWCKTCKED